MFSRYRYFNIVFSLFFVVALSSCGGGGCAGCASQPLPAGGLPADQTVEGGGQIRVTPAGFTKLQSIVPALINDSFADGVCIPSGSALSTDYCYQTQGNCAPGCKVNVNLASTQIQVTNNNTLNLRLVSNLSSSMPLDPPLFSSCTMNFTADSLMADLDIGFNIDPATGELKIQLASINDVDLSGVDFSGCGAISFLADLVVDIMDSFLGDFIIQLLTPTINDLIQGFLPDPLGIAGMTDLHQLLGGVSPGTEGFMETRMVPGGFVSLNNGGMTLGMITGFNADEDPATRTPDLDNEPALCVPPFAAPNFAAPPAALPITTRGTFTLAAANDFRGEPDPQATDVAMGFSETTLDLLGHHLVTSGGMCLGIGPSTISQLNVGTFGLLVPSVAELASDAGKEPMLLVTRPQRPVDFTVGDGTVASPHITMGIKDLEVDFYAFLYERYVRLFTMSLTLNAGINLMFEQQPGQPAKIKPSIVGLSKENVQVKVLNNEFVRESQADLEARLPTIFDLVTPVLNNLQAFDVPPFAGFSLTDLRVQKVTTSEDDFIAIFANLGQSAMMRQLAARNPAAVALLDKSLRPSLMGDAAQIAPASRAVPTLVNVHAPAAAAVRSALSAQALASSDMPAVTFALATHDSTGKPLEWSWNWNGGLWHAYQPGGMVALRDPAFAYQGKFVIGLQSRVQGDYRTASAPLEFPIIIDSVEPKFLAAQALVNDGVLSVAGYDLVSQDNIQIAFGRVGAEVPTTAWQSGGTATLAVADAQTLAQDGEISVFLRDEAGNVGTVLYQLNFHGQASAGGCSCDSSGGSPVGSVLLAVLLGGILLRKPARQRYAARLARLPATRRMWLGNAVAFCAMVTVSSLFPGCNCGKAAGQACKENAECTNCPEGQLGYCIEDKCVCDDDIPAGRIGPYSDIAVGANGDIWVSAYAQSHGDLVMAKVTESGRIPNTAWQWVDGVPDVPPVKEGSKIRGGIDEPGADVGMYTSVAVTANGTPMASYFDRDTGSLKFAMKVGETWQKHVIDAGEGNIEGQMGTQAGLYSAMVLRSDDGRPGIAYLAHVVDAMGARAEVRFAAAQTPTPSSAADWQITVVDTAPIPADDPAAPDTYPLPRGLGLFVDLARLPNQAPVVVYYDRGNGDLKLAVFNPDAGKFNAPVLLDGAGDVDAGWSPSVAVDKDGVITVAYVSATKDDLMYLEVKQPLGTPEVIDNGYRIVGQSPDGLPKPEFHFIGEDATLLQVPGAGPVVVYQDATSHELLQLERLGTTWRRSTIAGAETPFVGAYGFFAAAAVGGGNLAISNWVVNLPEEENWVEVFVRPALVQ